MKKYMIFTSIGFELVGLILAAITINEPLEKKFHSGGLILVGLLIASLVGWLVQVLWLLNRLNKQESGENPPEQ